MKKSSKIKSFGNGLSKLSNVNYNFAGNSEFYNETFTGSVKYFSHSILPKNFISFIPVIISSIVSKPSSLFPVIVVIEFLFTEKFILNKFGRYFEVQFKASILNIL